MASTYFSLSSASGSGDGNVTVTSLSDNATGSHRTGTMTITSDNGDVDAVVVSVVQYARPTFRLESGQPTEIVAAGGSNLSVALVNSDYPFWLVASAADYSYIDIVDGDAAIAPMDEASAYPAGSYHFYFSFDANHTGSSRSCGFALRYRRMDGSLGYVPVDSSAYAFTFTQASEAYSISLSPSAGSVSYEGGTNLVYVVANDSWTLTSDHPEYLSFYFQGDSSDTASTTISGSGNMLVYAWFQENDTAYTRSATLTGTCGDATATATISQDAPATILISGATNASSDMSMLIDGTAYTLGVDSGNYTLRSDTYGGTPTSLANAFKDNTRITTVQTWDLDTSSVTSMGYMFQGCTALNTANLYGMDTTSCGSFSYLFQGCSSLQSIDLSGFIIDDMDDVTNMFQGCSSLASVILDNSDWITLNIIGNAIVDAGYENNVIISADGCSYTFDGTMWTSSCLYGEYGFRFDTINNVKTLVVYRSSGAVKEPFVIEMNYTYDPEGAGGAGGDEVYIGIPFEEGDSEFVTDFTLQDFDPDYGNTQIVSCFPTTDNAALLQSLSTGFITDMNSVGNTSYNNITWTSEG